MESQKTKIISTGKLEEFNINMLTEVVNSYNFLGPGIEKKRWLYKGNSENNNGQTNIERANEIEEF